MSITLIAAMDQARAIGIGNALPWRLPAEMAFFTRNTVGKTVVMGRKTFESLPKPLKDRKNVIITRQATYNVAGCEIVHSLEEALAVYGEEELMVIGGADIYGQFLPYADTLMLSHVETVIEGADAYFPDVDFGEWELVESVRHEQDERNKFSFTFNVYKRKMNKS